VSAILHASIISYTMGQ